MKGWALLGLAAITALAATAQNIAPDVLLLSRVRDHARQQLAHLPNYTCTQTIQRFRKGPGPKEPFKPYDTVRLEVLFSGGKELYAAPGERRFVEDPTKFIGAGMIGTGVFAGWLRTLFVSNQAMFTWRGQESIKGQPRAQWDFRVPLMSSGYTLTVAGTSGKAGIKGTFGADPESLDVSQLQVDSDEIELGVPALEVNTSVIYARMLVGETEALLPQTAVQRMLLITFAEERNYLEFTHCQAFHSESSLVFEPPASGLPPEGPKFRVAPAPAQLLPKDLDVSIALAKPVTGTDLVGSPISARVLAPVRFKGRVVVREGATITGRLRRLEHYDDQGGYFVVGLEFTGVESLNMRFYAELREVDRSAGAERSLRKSTVKMETAGLPGSTSWQQRITTEHTWIDDLPGVGTFFVRGNRLNLPAGLKMVWKTVSVSSPQSANP